MSDYCSLTLDAVERDTTDTTPLEQYAYAGYARPAPPSEPVDDRVLARDAAVRLTASSWGPPFGTAYDDGGEWWYDAYDLACRAVEDAVVEAVVGGGRGDSA